jgi:hypothetical protein
MPVPIASGLVRLLTVYLAAGGLLLPWLYRRAWPKAAPGARGASWGFFLASLPGTLLLWPALLLRARRPIVPTGDDIGPLRRTQTLLIALAGATVIAAALFGRLSRRPSPVMEALPAGIEGTR